jgi:serine acetyltransferase
MPECSTKRKLNFLMFYTFLHSSYFIVLTTLQRMMQSLMFSYFNFHLNTTVFISRRILIYFVVC